MSQKILIIEDTKDVRELLQQLFQASGFETETACNGAEALELLANIERPALILLDLMMPVMNGWEFRMRQKHDVRIADIPVVLISADGNVDDQSFNIGAEDYLQKPFRYDALIRIAEKYCSAVPKAA